MTYLIYILWLLVFIVYLRASYLAIGNTKKLFPSETFLLEQQIVALLSLAGLILSIILRKNIFIVANTANLLYILLFYLQPTPRISKLLLKLFIATNLILFIIIAPNVI